MDDKTLTSLKARAFDRFPVAFVLTNPNIADNPIVYVNTAFETLTGYSADIAIGQNCRFLQGPNTDKEAVRELGQAIRENRGHQTELLNYRADGSTFINELLIEPIHDDSGKLRAFLGLQRRKVLGESAGDTLQQQLQEVQHRVKNHLQMVVSMIRLQSKKARSDDPTEDYAALAYRVETLQLLYQELNKASGTDEIPIGAYLSRIATAIGHLEGRETVRLNIATESFYAPVEVAARVGLLASELITNAFQHAFEDRHAGLVEVSLKQLSGGVMRLAVMDDGIGMPEGIAWPNGNSMGAMIVSSLLRGIEGKMNIARGVAGTTISVDVPLPESRAQHEN